MKKVIFLILIIFAFAIMDGQSNVYHPFPTFKSPPMQSLTFRSCGQTRFENITYPNPTDTISIDSMPNWDINKNYIAIDTLYVCKEPILIDGHTFNYFRKDYPKKDFNEYGYVNSKKIPTGYWMYFNQNRKWRPAAGQVSRGYKIGEWGYDCAYICKIKYRWNLIRSKTIISKKKILHD